MKKLTQQVMVVGGGVLLLAVVGSCATVSLMPVDEAEAAARQRMASRFSPQFTSYRYDFEREYVFFDEPPDANGVITASVGVEVVKDAGWRELLNQLESLDPGLTLSVCLTPSDPARTRAQRGGRPAGYCTWHRLEARPDVVLTFGSTDWTSHHQARAETIRRALSQQPPPPTPVDTDPRDRSASGGSPAPLR